MTFLASNQERLTEEKSLCSSTGGMSTYVCRDDFPTRNIYIKHG